MTATKRTAMADAFEQAGVSRADMVFYSAALAYLRDGGTVDGAAVVVARAAQQLSSEGHPLSVTPFEGAKAGQSDRGITGRLGSERPALAARDARGPSAGQRAASARIAVVAAQTALDRYRTADGKAWGDVGAHELEAMAHDGAVAAAVKAHLGPLSNKQRFMTLRDLIKPDQFEAIIKRAREQSHGA